MDALDRNISELRWGVRRRLEFIELRLIWDGRFNRKDLSDTFGISAQQASADIGLYSRIAPQNLDYDRAEKAYRSTENFTPRLLTEMDSYLFQLVALENNWMRQEDSWIGNWPPVEMVSLRSGKTDSTVVLHVLDAIRNGWEIDIKYRSLTGSSKPSRSIAPHALAYSNGRWYVRSWSREHNDFRDYSLSRIGNTTNSRRRSIDPAWDYEWAQEIDLVVAPNPMLSEERQEAVAFELGMSNRQLVHRCRLSLCFYFMSQYNLDVEPGLLRPEKQQIILLNLDLVKQAREVSRKLANEALDRLRIADSLA